MVVYNTQFEDASNNITNYLNDIKNKKEFKETSLPENDKTITSPEEDTSNNPFLDISLRQFIDDFVLTWHKIIFDLLEKKRYDKLKQGEIWDKFLHLIQIFIDVFWVPERIFYVGVGFIIFSFFVFFITVTN